MAGPPCTIGHETRRHQMFPVLEQAEMERMRRFGGVRAFEPGEVEGFISIPVELPAAL